MWVQPLSVTRMGLHVGCITLMWCCGLNCMGSGMEQLKMIVWAPLELPQTLLSWFLEFVDTELFTD